LSAWPKLKPGGTLVYSTCTFAPEENELQIQKLLDKFEDEVQIEQIDIKGLRPMPPLKEWNSKQIDPKINDTLRIFPTKEIEGFYIAKLTKKK
jgi:16S rRNA (cytosine1407-C5)-methyltransferase